MVADRQQLEPEPRMNIHKNARTTPYSRLRIALRVDGGEKAATVAADFVTDARIAWRDAYDMQMRAAVRPLQQAAE